MLNHQKIIAVLPAYNAEKTLKLTVEDINKNIGLVDEIILVDDASGDNTVDISRKLGLKTFIHKINTGYGGNQKTCYQAALKAGADVVVMVHPDHQYDPKYIPELVKPIVNGECAAVFGSRMMRSGEARNGGMPEWKYLANIFLTKIENLVLGLNLTEYHSGFRAYSKKVLTTLPLDLNSDDFVFDTEIIIQLKINGFKIQEIPINTKYFKDASSISFYKSVRYGFAILKNMLVYVLTQMNIKKYPRYEKISQ